LHTWDFARTTGQDERLDPAGNLLEVVTVIREDGDEIVIHAMRMRAMYEPLLRGALH